MSLSRSKQLYNEIIKKLHSISGYHTTKDAKEGVVARIMADNSIISRLGSDIASMDLKEYSDKERIYLIDTAIKSGNLSAVKKLAEKFIEQNFSDDIRIPSANNLEHPYRPVFWLAAVVTRREGVPEKNYADIEKYLCERFQIPAEIKIGDKIFTRETYVAAVNIWKDEENLRLKTEFGRTKTRY